MTASQTEPAPHSKSRFSTVLPYLLVAPPILMVFGLIFFPALQSTLRTLTDAETGTFSLARYEMFFADKTSVTSLIFTIQIALESLLGLFVICFPLALYLRFNTSRIATGVQMISLLPMFVPGIMSAYALIRFVRGRGLFETLIYQVSPLLADAYYSPYVKPEGIVIGLIWEAIPFTVLILLAGLRQLDNGLIESAQDIGANRWYIFTRIILPLMRRSILIAFCLNFISMFGAYTIPYLLGPAAPQTMGVLMQRTLQDYQQPLEAETQAVITFLICSLVGLVYVQSVSGERVRKG
jgi:putative spermidine/putrescine transport system permease protein